MSKYEYRVVPAPTKSVRAKGVRGNEARFANTLETVMNDMAKDGWEYLRVDTLPVEQRQGITSKTTVFQNVLIFRRALESEAPKAQPRRIEATQTTTPRPALPAPQPAPEPAQQQRPAANAQRPPKKVLNQVFEADPSLAETRRDRSQKPRINPALAARAAQIKARSTAAE